MVRQVYDRFSRLDTILVCDRQTDRQTDTARRHRPRYAERRAGKNEKKLVPWGTDGRLPFSGDFRSLIVE